MKHGDISNESAPGVMIDIESLFKTPSWFTKVKIKFYRYIGWHSRADNLLELIREGREFIYFLQTGFEEDVSVYFCRDKTQQYGHKLLESIPHVEVIVYDGINKLLRDMESRGIYWYFSSLKNRKQFGGPGVYAFESFSECLRKLRELS